MKYSKTEHHRPVFAVTVSIFNKEHPQKWLPDLVWDKFCVQFPVRTRGLGTVLISSHSNQNAVS